MNFSNHSCHTPENGAISFNECSLNERSELERGARLGTYKISAQMAHNTLKPKKSNKNTPNQKKSIHTVVSKLRTKIKAFGKDTYEYYFCDRFLNYLEEKEHCHIVASGILKNGKDIDHDFGYPHRYTLNYVRGRYAKMYLLDEWYQTQKHLPLTFLTLTTYNAPDRYTDLSNNYTVSGIIDSFKRLQDGKHLLLREMLRRHKGLQYVYVVEPHESGYPHIHMIIFAHFSIEEQIEYRKMWEKWGIGSFEHGLDFDEREGKEKIGNIRNYLLSYMLKSLPGYESKHKKPVIWTKEEVLFNAVAQKYKFRTWDSSQKLKIIMKNKYQAPENIDWQKVMLHTPLNEVQIWKKKNAEEIEEELEESRTPTDHEIELLKMVLSVSEKEIVVPGNIDKSCICDCKDCDKIKTCRIPYRT